MYPYPFWVQLPLHFGIFISKLRMTGSLLGYLKMRHFIVILSPYWVKDFKNSRSRGEGLVTNGYANVIQCDSIHQ